MIDECGTFGGMKTGMRNLSSRRKYAPVDHKYHMN
jgi:hypothetical protein